MKNSFKKAFALASIGAVAVSAASMNVFAAADNGLTQDQIDASTYKPTVTMSKILLDEVPADKNVTVQVIIDAEDYTYASTGFHIYFDKRVECPANRIGNPTVKDGACIVKDEGRLAWNTPKYDDSASEQGMNGIFLASAGDYDFGGPGVFAEITLTLPSDAAAGDVYPLDIIYKSNPSAEDLFIDCKKTDAAMQAWTFTQGIYNAETNNNFTAEAAHVEKCAALANIDKSFDGYIAIADGEEPPIVTTTTEAPPVIITTTTTAAPVVPPVTTTTTEAEPPIVVTTTTTGAPVVPVASDTTTVSTVSGSSTTKTSSTKASSTTKGGTTTKKSDAPKTGVAGVGVAVAGLAVAIGTAFVLRKKED